MEHFKNPALSLYQRPDESIQVIQEKQRDSEASETEVYEPPPTPKKAFGEKFMMWTMLLMTTISWTLYGNIATFYPPYKEKHHESISDTMVGTVLSMFELSVLLCSPLVSMSLQKVGKKNFILFGALSTISASIGFGLLVYVSNDTLFFVLSLIMRFI